MNEWKEYKLGEVTSVLGDGIHGTPKYDDEGPIYFINGNNLEDGHIVLKETTKRVSYEEASKHSKPLCNRTILVSINGTIGNVAKYNGEPCILGKSACYFNVNENVDLDFIYYVVANNNFKDTITHLSTGTTIKNVSLKTMREYSFMMPSLDTQRRISRCLKSLDDKIEVNRRINEQLEELAQALFKSWFVDFEPFKDGEFVESELGMIPKGWKVGNLLDVAELFDSQRKPLSGRERDAMQKIYPYYGATSIMDYVDNYIFDGVYLLMGEDGSVVNEKGFPYLQYVWGKFWPNNHAHVMQGKNGYTTEMLHTLLSITNVQAVVTGAVQAKISQTGMKKIPVIIANKGVLDDFSEKVTPIYNKIRANSEEITHLTNLRDTLLPKLMSGEIDVNEVEI